MLYKTIFLSFVPYISYDIYHNIELLAGIIAENHGGPRYKINPPYPYHIPVEIKKLPFVLDTAIIDSDNITSVIKRRIDDILNGRIVANVCLNDSSYNANEYIRKYNSSPLTKSTTFKIENEKGMMSIENRIYDEGRSNKIYDFILNNNRVTIRTKHSLFDKMYYNPDKITFNDFSLIQKILYGFTCYVYNREKRTGCVNLVQHINNKHYNRFSNCFDIPTVKYIPQHNSNFTVIHAQYLTDDLCKWLLNERKNVQFFHRSKCENKKYFDNYYIETRAHPNKPIHVYIDNFETVPDVLKSDKRFYNKYD